MERQLTARAMRPSGADRLRHVGKAENAIVAVSIGTLCWDLAPILSGGSKFDPTAKIVGIGNDKRTGFAVKLDRTVSVSRDVKAHCHSYGSSAHEHQNPGSVGGDLNGNARARERLPRDGAAPAA